MSTLINWLEAGRQLAERIPYSFVALLARVAAASVFWRSGQTKVDGFLHIKDSTFFLFREEYMVPLSALGLIFMTAVIQIFVYPEGWPDHILWFAALLLIVARGPGAISLDHLIWSRAQSVPATAR